VSLSKAHTPTILEQRRLLQVRCGSEFYDRAVKTAKELRMGNSLHGSGTHGIIKFVDFVASC
jgi:hypothetical protein